MKKKVILGDDAKMQILDGARLLYQAVSTTLGPKGQNAVIEAYGEPVVTHDGVTVARAIDVASKDAPGVRVGIEMIKSSSSRTNDNVGDGTTSSTILAYHLIQGGMSMIRDGKNPMILRRELDVATQKVLSKLKDLSEPVKTEKSAIEIATISSENKDVGEQVGKMFHKLGKDGLVAIEMGTKPETEYEIVEGYTFDRGFASQYMVDDQRTQTSTLDKTKVLLAHQVITAADVMPLLQQLYQAGEDQVFIIADDFKSDFIDQALLQKSQMNIIAVKAPGFGDQRTEMLKDISKLTGAVLFGTTQPRKLSTATTADFGTCGKVVVSLKETVLTGTADVSEYIEELTTKLDKTKTEFERNKIEKRIAKLRSKVGQIRVGGHTEMEAEERKYLIDDAVAAVEAALKDGIVPGGGTTYIELSRHLDGSTDGERLLKEALLAPFQVLATNAGLRHGKLIENLKEHGKGYDIMMEPDEDGNLPLIDLKEHGVIDPAMVIRQAVTNASSVAGSALTTGVLIVNDEEDEDEEDE